MHTGQYISGAGHLLLIGWLLVGDIFSSEPPPIELTEVSVISGAEFEALMAAQRAPQQSSEVAQPQAPEVSPDTPEVSAAPDQAIAQPTPLQTETPPEDTPPEVTELALPPEAEVADTPPERDEPVGDQAVLTPEVAPQAVPRPVERVAPEAVAPPEPDATPDPVEQAAVTPDNAGETTQETQEAQAPPEATTEVVTEATAAPAASSRPPGRRPAAPAPQGAATPETAETDTPAETDTDSAVQEALRAALEGEAQETPAPSGPPLTAGEKDNLRVAVGKCWNYGSLSTEAQRTTITVAVQMARNGTPIVGTIRLLGRSGGTDAGAQNAFGAARRAIILCGSKGYPLPPEKFSQWQTIEMTFNPDKMRR